jgi:hypothetical protein
LGLACQRCATAHAPSSIIVAVMQAPYTQRNRNNQPGVKSACRACVRVPGATFDADVIVHGSANSPLAAEITFRCLHGRQPVFKCSCRLTWRLTLARKEENREGSACRLPMRRWWHSWDPQALPNSWGGGSGSRYETPDAAIHPDFITAPRSRTHRGEA